MELYSNLFPSVVNEKSYFSEIISLVLNRSASQAKETFGSKKRARALINETIEKLEGDLL